MSDKILISVKDLKKYFDLGGGHILKAVDGISFDIEEGKTLGLVGESGCGKSTTGKMLINLFKPTGGDIMFENKNIHKLNKSQLTNFRKNTQIIFQDPYSSLNPRMKVLDIIAEGFDIFGECKGMERQERVLKLLQTVGLEKEAAQRYPHEFSGGQRQRIGIARAISLNPKFVVCDEPISALDVSIQAQIVNLLNKLQKDLSLTYLFISHDIKMVKLISDRIAVMYLGKIVEIGNSEEVFNNPLHPYSKILISAIPIANPRIEKERKRIKLNGDIPSPIDRKSACVFVNRCPHKIDICEVKEPKLSEIDESHKVACFLYNN